MVKIFEVNEDKLVLHREMSRFYDESPSKSHDTEKVELVRAEMLKKIRRSTDKHLSKIISVVVLVHLISAAVVHASDQFYRDGCRNFNDDRVSYEVRCMDGWIGICLT